MYKPTYCKSYTYVICQLIYQFLNKFIIVKGYDKSRHKVLRNTKRPILKEYIR